MRKKIAAVTITVQYNNVKILRTGKTIRERVWSVVQFITAKRKLFAIILYLIFAIAFLLCIVPAVIGYTKG